MSNHIGYARLLRRIQALMIDGIIIPVSFFLVIIISSKFGLQGVPLAILAGSVIFILEPFLVSTTGGTLGQYIVGIQVKSKKTGNNINIFFAMVRFLLKIFLGVISLITVFVTRYHQGFHDLLVGSIVVVKNPESRSTNEILKERVFEEQGYVYPTSLRKILTVIVYNVVIFLLVTNFVEILISDQCLNSNWCTGTDQFIILGIEIFWLASIPFTIIMCWKGFLFGCRRKAIKANEQASMRY